MRNLKYIIVILVLIVPIKEVTAEQLDTINIEKTAFQKELKLELLKSKIRLQIAELKYQTINE